MPLGTVSVLYLTLFALGGEGSRKSSQMTAAERKVFRGKACLAFQIKFLECLSSGVYKPCTGK